MNKLKPRAERISPFNPRKEVIYRCAVCDTSFAILGQQIKYCFGCGAEVNWDVLTKLKDSIDTIWMKSNTDLSLDKFEEEFIKELNKKQL